MQLNDRVVIGGRTMLGPGFSLVGFEGRIVSSDAQAPPGTRAVWMDWQQQGYSPQEIAKLPAKVNVPSHHLELVGQGSAEPIEQPVMPGLSLVTGGNGKVVGRDGSELVSARPRLELV